jgi:hypothetical protein
MQYRYLNITSVLNIPVGVQVMATKLLALSVGFAMLSGAGISQAADVAQTNTHSKAASSQIVVVDTKTPKTGDLQNHGRVALTDDQMNGVTAGHWGTPGLSWFHWGDFNYMTRGGTWISLYGLHQG